MNIVTCVKGHFYDGDRYAFCPECMKKKAEAEKAQGEYTLELESYDVSGETVALSQAIEQYEESTVLLSDSCVQLVRGNKDEIYCMALFIEIGGNGYGTVWQINKEMSFWGVEKKRLFHYLDMDEGSNAGMQLMFNYLKKEFILQIYDPSKPVSVQGDKVEKGCHLHAYDIVETEGVRLLFIPVCSKQFCWERLF